MEINKPTLIEFEEYRKGIGYIPPAGSNSFHTIGDGRINLYCFQRDDGEYRFTLDTDSGTVHTGDGTFIVDDTIYHSMYVINSTTLVIDKTLIIDGTKLCVFGTIEMTENSELIVRNGGEVIFYSISTFTIHNQSTIDIDDSSKINIYGEINIHLSVVDRIIENNRVFLDSAAVLNVDGIDLGERIESLNDYEISLRTKQINVYTQGESNTDVGRLGYLWKGGSPSNYSQILQMNVLYGDAILGDFKFSVLGMPEHEVPDLQIISDLYVKEDCTLYISERYDQYQYIRPELYLGIIITNNVRPADCVVDGTIIVDGENCKITLDRRATMHISETGTVILTNDAVMRSTNNENDDVVLYIDGTLIIDTIDQILSFESGNIVFGENGKIKIMNPDTGERTLLFTTPNGILDSDLYRLFRSTIDHIEYHVSNNNGIGIDQYYEYYSKDMTQWFGDRRIEKAIHDGILVWHDGGFIELDHSIIPWAKIGCSLLHASRIFKSFGSTDAEKLQEVVERLHYTGCENILFRFIEGEDTSECTLVLNDIHMTHVNNEAISDTYRLTVDNDGELFLKNKVASIDDVIQSDARDLPLVEGDNTFQLS